MAPNNITIAPTDLTSPVSRALIASLNEELASVYSEPGATHFRLEPEEVGDGRGAFLVIYQDAARTFVVGVGNLPRQCASTADLRRAEVATATQAGRAGAQAVAD